MDQSIKKKKKQILTFSHIVLGFGKQTLFYFHRFYPSFTLYTL